MIVINPATAHASSSQPGAPINRADSAEVIKMPEPIIEPITIIVASSGPRARMSPGLFLIVDLVAHNELCGALILTP